MTGWQKIGCILALLFLMMAGATASVSAETSIEEERSLWEQQWQASGADDLWEQLPTETQEQLIAWGIDEDTIKNGWSVRPDTAWEWLLKVLQEQSGDPLSAGCATLGVVLLCGLLDGVRRLSDDHSLRQMFQSIASLSVCGFMLASLTSCMQRACEAAQSCLVFMSSLVPVYAAILTSLGQVTTAVSYQSVVLWVCEALMALLTGVVLPLLLVALALSMVGSACPTWRLQSLGQGISRVCIGGVGLFTAFFTGLLTLQSTASSAMDTVSGRAVRFSLSNLIPVVGSTLSDAFLTVKNCLVAVRSTVGVLGIASTAILLLPPLVACMEWSLILWLCSAFSELFSLSTLAAMTRGAGTVIKTVWGLLTVCGVFLIVAIDVMMRVGGG